MNDDLPPLVSIIIPCYNYANYLPESVGSIINQTYSYWECIIIDDGSTDNSKEAAQLLCAADNRVRYFSQPNSGPAIARNHGLKNANGEFIQFLDADDLLEPCKLEHQVELFKKNKDFDIVYSGVKYFNSSDTSKLYDNLDLKSGAWMKNHSGKGDVMIQALLTGNIMVIESPLVRRSLYEKFGMMSEELFFNEDWELWTRFALGNAVFHYDNSHGSLVLVRVHDSYSKDNFRMFVYGLLACLKINKSISAWKYKRIMIPKINYHKRIIDEKLIDFLNEDKGKAIESALFISNLTGLKRYSLYSKLFEAFPVWFCYIYSRFVFICHKLKNVIIYA